MKNIPRIKFANLPTPIESLPRLSGEFGSVRIFIKRDDLTGLAFGGNKSRKLEFLVAEALAHGAKTLLTAGAVQSNHCRQTAAAAARFGLRCILVLDGDVPDSLSGNILLDHLLGAQIIWTQRAIREETLSQVFQSSWEQGGRPYMIPYGGSNPVGASAYVFAMQELEDQVANGHVLSDFPDWIVFPSSSGGTQAGLIVGARLFNFPGKVLGISVDEPDDILKNRVAGLAKSTAEFLGEHIDFSPDEILVDSGFISPGYGVAQDLERDAILKFSRLEGILLDPVYTARAAGGMFKLIEDGYFPEAASILFWHTGGSPALFADRYRDLYGF